MRIGMWVLDFSPPNAEPMIVLPRKISVESIVIGDKFFSTPRMMVFPQPYIIKFDTIRYACLCSITIANCRSGKGE